MPVANSNWTLPPVLPEDPDRLRIVEVHHTHINIGWKFEDNSTLSNHQARVLRWAYVEV